MSNDLMTRITALKKETASVWLGMRVESDQSELVTLIAKLTDIVQDMIAQMPPPPPPTAPPAPKPQAPRPHPPHALFDGGAETAGSGCCGRTDRW